MSSWLQRVLCIFLLIAYISALECSEDEIEDNCPAGCPAADYCPKSKDDNQTCPIPETCPPATCKCRFNYRRANDTCIPTRDCPPFDCRAPNEEFDACPPLCPSDDCSQATIEGKCPRFFGLLECKPKCICIRNYRRKNGVCVPYDQCPGIGTTSK